MSKIPTYTGATRPTSPAAGDAIYLTDANKFAIYDGDVSDWRYFQPDTVVYNSAGPSELHYTGGLYDSTSAQYYVATAPIMHFDASFMDGNTAAGNPSNGVVVGTWGDRSGNSTDYSLSQSSASIQPDYYDSGSLKGVTLGGSDSFNLANSLAVTSTSDFTQIIVHTDTSGSGRISGLSPNSHANANGFFVGGGGNGPLKMGGSNISSPPTFSSTNPNLHIVRKTGTTFDYWYQGGARHDTGSRTVNNTYTKMFTTYSTAGIDSRIHEVIIFSAAISVADLEKIRSYLDNKYSLNSTTLS